jgi:hypothetical protein
MLVAVLGALIAFAPQGDVAGSAPAPQAEKPKMVEVCTRVPDPGGRVPKRVCKKVEQKQETAEKGAEQRPASGQDGK